MAKPNVAGEIDAVLLFVDIVDSSKFSSVLGFQKYARRLINFQEVFRTLGRRYFPEPDDRAIGFCQVDSRGDEGTIFCIEQDANKKADLVFRAIEFVYHLKAIMYFGPGESEAPIGQEKSPIRMGIGAGIHVGKVGYATELNKNHRKEISQIDGYSINKAKRIESASRQGVYSGIVLSKEAAKLLEGEPIVFHPFIASMKGIEDNAQLYEIQSGHFEDLEVKHSDIFNERLIRGVKYLADNPDSIDEEWLKALIISTLHVKIESTISADHKRDYYEKQKKMAWHSMNESDPIILYMRARDYGKKGEITQQIRYLKQILEKHPGFVHAKKALIEACWKISKCAEDRSEKIFARDLAEEFLNKFPFDLSQHEKELYIQIVKNTKKTI